MSGERIDVLAVISAAATTLKHRDCQNTAADLVDAKDAVAALIEAAKNVERQPALDDMTFMANRPGVALAIIKLRVALARVTQP